MKYFFLLGRVLFASLFLLKSLEHFSLKMIDRVAHLGVPMTSFFVPLAGILAFLGGLSIFLGYRAKAGAWLLVIFLIPTTFIVHRFWESKDFFAQMMHQYCFLKNLSLLGACLMIGYFGSGPFSLDAKKKK